MDECQEDKLCELLNDTFNPEGDTYILAITAATYESAIYKVRIALTYQDSDGINPYFDGAELFVQITPEGILFVNEELWADGPPLMEGSPIELAFGWVSELNAPFFVSPELLRLGETDHEDN
ncbi:hypothetical protein BSK63_23635 [Paenibacillus odorifer]|uniref:hypothetical protein n=1 Tax=Paenibacillus odorifer TaxID=189426 RepID=UPI00096CBBEF|nr:hypothetical protein [Paenibacillus odorifer]OME28905.1 hypothetical protein BSK63_23635 [Paenibacillus odorifer]